MRVVWRALKFWDIIRKRRAAGSWVCLRAVAMLRAWGWWAAAPDFGGSCEILGSMRSRAVARGRA